MAKAKSGSLALSVKPDKRVSAVKELPKEPAKSRMEALALEYDLLCAATEAIHKGGEKPGANFINVVDRRLPAIEEMLSTSEPTNLNDLFIFAVMMRSKLAILRDSVGPLIDHERYGDGARELTIEDYQEVRHDIRSNVADLQAMISTMLGGFERVSGTTPKNLGIGRIAQSTDGSERV
ncbi:hypothetical protein RLW55_16890 [Hyphomicrobium sp. B1]|uniref:hypothetical protein n=1 Tax=Hyphomicrobium sp. B1 TaxID=3075651 RepID=UPI003C3057B1